MATRIFHEWCKGQVGVVIGSFVIDFNDDGYSTLPDDEYAKDLAMAGLGFNLAGIVTEEEEPEEVIEEVETEPVIKPEEQEIQVEEKSETALAKEEPEKPIAEVPVRKANFGRNAKR